MSKQDRPLFKPLLIGHYDFKGCLVKFKDPMA